MSKLQILLVEDNPSAALDAEMLIAEMGYELLATVDNATAALEKIYAHQPDLILLDIHLRGDATGLDIAREIKPLQIPIIFTTAIRDEQIFVEAKRMHSFGYLVKPFDKLTLQGAIESVVKTLFSGNYLSQQDAWTEDVLMKNCLLIKQNNVLQKVNLEDILFIEGEGNYCTIYAKGKRFVLKMSLKKILEELDKERFMPVHKSHIVQLDKLESVDLANNLLTVGDKQVPLGKHFKARLMNRFKTLK